MSRTPTASPDPARPRRTRAAGRGVDRRPYPTAPTLTRPSPARTSAAQRRPREDGEPTPSTVWLCLPDSDAVGSGLADIVTKIVTSFSGAGGRVGLLVWPTTAATVETASGSETAPPPTSTKTTRATVASLADAVAAAGRLPVLLLTWSPSTSPADPAGEPPGQGRQRVLTEEERTGVDGTGVDESPAAAPDPTPLDLIITVVGPGAVDDTSAARATLLASRALRRGGILTVLTHCDRQHGRLVDPGGLLVTAGQNADLLYLQHIVAVHAPIHDSRIHPTESAGEDPEGWPEFHCRVHSDLYVLTQQQDRHRHDPDPVDGVDPSTGADR